MRKQFFIISFSQIFLLIFANFSPSFASSLKLDLKRCIQIAIERNSAIKEKDYRLLSAKYKARSAFCDLLPKFETNYSYTRLKREPYAILHLGPLGSKKVSTGLKDNYDFKLKFTETLFDGFFLLNRYKMSKIGVNIERFRKKKAILDLTKDVKKAYFRVLLAKKYDLVAKEEVENLSSHLKDAESFYEYGVIPYNDLLKSKVALADALQKEERAKNDLRFSISYLASLLELDIDTPIEIEDIFTYKPMDVKLPRLINVALVNRPEIKMVEASIKKERLYKKMAKSNFLPKIYLVGEYERIGDHPDVKGNGLSTPENMQITVSLNWTFFEWGKTIFDTKSKHFDEKAARRVKREIEKSIKLEVEKAYLDLLVSKKNVETARVALKQAKENYRITDLRYKEQMTTSTEVLDARTLLTQAETNYYEALYGYKLALANLERAIGEEISQNYTD